MRADPLFDTISVCLTAHLRWQQNYLRRAASDSILEYIVVIARMIDLHKQHYTSQPPCKSVSTVFFNKTIT